MWMLYSLLPVAAWFGSQRVPLRETGREHRASPQPQELAMSSLRQEDYGQRRSKKGWDGFEHAAKSCIDSHLRDVNHSY